MSRLTTTLIGGAISAILALLHHAYVGGPYTGYIPQTTAGWVSFYVGICTPWVLIGALVGAGIGGRKKARRTLEKLAPRAGKSDRVEEN